MALSLKAVLGLCMFTKLLSQVEVILHANVLFLYFIKPLECCVSNLTCSAVNACQESAEIVPSKLPRLTQKVVTLWLLVAESCTSCHSWS